MRRPIARIKINAGNPGWYDPLTNIHLTISRPEAIVFEGANTTNIKKGVAYKLISVIDGDLEINNHLYFQRLFCRRVYTLSLAL